MASEREKMDAGDWYHCIDDELDAMRLAARMACHAQTITPPDVRGDMADELRALFGHAGTGIIEAPFHCAYGVNIHLNGFVYFNAGCTLIDTARIDVGDGTMFGPGVHVYCADHHHDPALRKDGLERGLPVKIGTNVWVGGGAKILPGITIGDDAIIGAGAVVTRDVAAGTCVVGNPARAVAK
jgi:maltose O-acetyltransferase